MPQKDNFAAMEDQISLLYQKYLLSTGVSIDTRTLEKGNLFFAISGPHFNANEFALDALAKGASYAVVDQEKYVTDARIFHVEDGLQALQDLASYHRDQFKGPVIAITGSNGKTTTKELMTRVLQAKYNTHSTPGNYNNHIGVPLTLLQLHKQTEIAIIEMGANHVGEIAALCKIAKPTHGLITNIGNAHTETFGGIEGVIRGKSELFDYLRQSKGQVFINMEDPVLSNMAKRFDSPICYPSSDFQLTATDPFLKIQLDHVEKETAMIGTYNFTNMAAAYAVGRFFQVEEALILEALASYQPQNARSQLIKKGSNTYILDAYNANPDSMRAALTHLAQQKGQRLAILGDMNELQDSDMHHKNILKLAQDHDIPVMTLGEKIGRVAAPENHFNSIEALSEAVKSLQLHDATILLKASRSVQLEALLPTLK